MSPTRRPTTRLWAARGQPRPERLSANPFRFAGGERHPRVVRQPNGRLTGRAKSRWPRLYCRAWKGHAVPGGPQFFGFEMWQLARATGADLLWRMKKNMRMACEKRLPDGSYLSHIYPSERDRRQQDQWECRAGDRLPPGRRRRRGADLPAGHHHPGPGEGTGPRIGGSLSRALGDRNRVRRTEDPPAGRPRSCCAAKPPIWCARSSTGC